MKPIKALRAGLALLLLLLLTAPCFAQEDITPKWLKKPQAEQILQHTGFTVSYNNVTKCPNWVAWTLTKEKAGADITGRTDFFTTDPMVSGPQAEYRDYSNNIYKYDRGHMAPSADFKWDRKANEETFYLTNICPQNHTLNEGLWLELEQRCRTWAKLYNATVHIVCGPLFGIEHLLIGNNLVEVPERFFKAIFLEDGNGRAYGIAFILPNLPLDVQQDIFMYQVPMQTIRSEAGIDPFPGMSFAEPGKAHPFNISWKKPKQK